MSVMLDSTVSQEVPSEIQPSMIQETITEDAQWVNIVLQVHQYRQTVLQENILQ